MRLWHSSITVVVTMDASCDLHMSSCLLSLSRNLWMDFTLTCRRSLSAFLIIFLAFSDITSFMPDTNWYNPFIYASDSESVVIPLDTILCL